MNYLLDTSIYSQPLKKEPIPMVVQRWKEVGDSSCCTLVTLNVKDFSGIPGLIIEDWSK